jgi:hypothetical protein
MTVWSSHLEERAQSSLARPPTPGRQALPPWQVTLGARVFNELVEADEEHSFLRWCAVTGP